MSQSPESLAHSPVLPYIYKQPFAEPDVAEGVNREIPKLAALESRSDDIVETSPFEGMVNNEALDEEQAGRFGRVGSFVTSKFVELKTSAQDTLSNVGDSISEKIKNSSKLSKAATGLAVLALAGGAAEQATGETNPVNQKASTSALTGNTLKQACVSQGLEIPQLIHARMHNPGRKHNPRIQAIDVKVRYDALPEECNGEYRRLSHMTARLQNPLKPKRWYKAELGLNWREMFSYDATTNTGGNKAGTSGANITSNGHEGDNVFYKCSPGKRKTRARLVLRNQVKDLDTGKIVGQKFKKHPIKIDGGGC